jgi:hypothetical protein
LRADAAAAANPVGDLIYTRDVLGWRLERVRVCLNEAAECINCGLPNHAYMNLESAAKHIEVCQRVVAGETEAEAMKEKDKS